MCCSRRRVGWGPSAAGCRRLRSPSSVLYRWWSTRDRHTNLSAHIRNRMCAEIAFRRPRAIRSPLSCRRFGLGYIGFLTVIPFDVQSGHRLSCGMFTPPWGAEHIGQRTMDDFAARCRCVPTDLGSELTEPPDGAASTTPMVARIARCTSPTRCEHLR